VVLGLGHIRGNWGLSEILEVHSAVKTVLNRARYSKPLLPSYQREGCERFDLGTTTVQQS
jgi:hypothetical protein